MISDHLRRKWEDRLYGWIKWRGEREDQRAGADAKISSIYSGEQFGSGYREAGEGVLIGEALDTDTLMQDLREDKMNNGHKQFRALEVWAIGKGTQGMQAGECQCSINTYRERVEAGIVRLEILWARRRSRIAKCPRAFA